MGLVKNSLEETTNERDLAGAQTARMLTGSKVLRDSNPLTSLAQGEVFDSRVVYPTALVCGGGGGEGAVEDC